MIRGNPDIKDPFHFDSTENNAMSAGLMDPQDLLAFKNTPRQHQHNDNKHLTFLTPKINVEDLFDASH